MNKYLIFLAVIIIILVSAYIGYTINITWHGVYYPDGCSECEDNYIFSPIFKSKNQCEAWASAIQSKRNNESDDWECNKNCKFDDELDVEICD